jgi:hypothetical protein
VKGERVARRYPASEFPDVQGVRLVPLRSGAALINISATGILVRTTDGPRVGTKLTAKFEGTFCPASVEGRVARCEVAGIGPDGSIFYNVGLAFHAPIVLRQDLEADAAPPPAPETSAPEAAVEDTVAPVLRNRW